MSDEQRSTTAVEREALEELTGELALIKRELATLRAGRARGGRGQRRMPALVVISALLLALGTGLLAHALSVTGGGTASEHRAQARVDVASQVQGHAVPTPIGAASPLFCPACTLADIRTDNHGSMPKAAVGAYWPAAHLGSASLQGIDLRGATLRWAALEKADLSGAVLYDADLRRANLTQTNLKYTRLEFAQLSNVTAENADLTGAQLTFADLSNANLTNATITGANFNSVNLTNAYLRGARGQVRWPSSGIIFHNTICRNGQNSDSLHGTCPGLIQARPTGSGFPTGGGTPPIPQ